MMAYFCSKGPQLQILSKYDKVELVYERKGLCGYGKSDTVF